MTTIPFPHAYNAVTVRIGAKCIPGTGTAETYNRPKADRRAIRALIRAQQRGDWALCWDIRNRSSRSVARFPLVDA